MYYPFYTFVLQGHGSGTGQYDHRLGGRTTYRTDFTANQLIKLLGAHSCSAFDFTTNQLVELLSTHSCSVLTSSPTS